MVLFSRLLRKHLSHFAFPATTNPECLSQRVHATGWPLSSKLKFALFARRSKDYSAGITGQCGINKKKKTTKKKPHEKRKGVITTEEKRDFILLLRKIGCSKDWKNAQNHNGLEEDACVSATWTEGEPWAVPTSCWSQLKGNSQQRKGFRWRSARSRRVNAPFPTRQRRPAASRDPACPSSHQHMGEEGRAAAEGFN